MTVDLCIAQETAIQKIRKCAAELHWSGCCDCSVTVDLHIAQETAIQKIWKCAAELHWKCATELRWSGCFDCSVSLSVMLRGLGQKGRGFALTLFKAWESWDSCLESGYSESLGPDRAQSINQLTDLRGCERLSLTIVASARMGFRTFDAIAIPCLLVVVVLNPISLIQFSLLGILPTSWVFHVIIRHSFYLCCAGMSTTPCRDVDRCFFDECRNQWSCSPCCISMQNMTFKGRCTYKDALHLLVIENVRTGVFIEKN